MRRHPHVFGEARGLSPDEVKVLWDRIKSEEKAGKDPDKQAEQPAGALSGVPVGLPALTRALKLQQKAGKVGFDWNDPLAVLAKIREEADEIEAAISLPASARRPRPRSATCCSRSSTSHAISMPIPRQCCARPTEKFERRFGSIERALAARGKTPSESTLAEMDALWDEAKAAEK